MCPIINVWAQLSTNEKPVSFRRAAELRVSHSDKIPVVTAPRLNKKQLRRVEERMNEPQEPGIFGFGLKVDWNLDNSGVWRNLPDGGKLWQLEISCPKDRYILLYYDKFWIPEGGELFLYSKDRKQTLGAFTSRNNKGDREHPHRFATGLIRNCDAVLEYYQPSDVTSDAIISICNLVYGAGNYGFNKSDSSLVNVNCDEGYCWRGEQRAVARALFREVEPTDTTLAYAIFCSGSLISTSDLHGEPYFLTAYHCLPIGKKPWCSEYTDNIMDDALFYWEYEMRDCENDTIEPPYYSTVGADIVSGYETSADFALLRLKEDPNDLPDYTPYYLGWDRCSEPDTAKVCIHHPKGDVKKICFVNEAGMSSTICGDDIAWLNGDHWRVCWMPTLHGNGGVMKGSSGSPLLNESHKVIGQLHAGRISGDFHIGPDWFGKLKCSWNNDYDIHSLRPWLDPHEEGVNDVERVEGTLYVSKPSLLSRNEYIYGNIHITETGQLTINSNIETSGICPVTVEAGGKLIIDGGKFTNVNIDLKPGATLQIINGGVIETRDGFMAQKGAIVDVQYGRIY